MIFRRKSEDANLGLVLAEEWQQLLLKAQLNTLAIANAMLLLIDNPDIETDEIRKDLVGMIDEIENGIANFQEFVI